MKRAALVCLAALSLVGCGGPVEESAREATIDSVKQPLIYACDGSFSFTRYWYQNGVEVGREECYCDGTLAQVGELTGTYKQVVGAYCN
ncbi:MAG: hypothetical protein ACXU86_17710 [Archangium sp.]